MALGELTVSEFAAYFAERNMSDGSYTMLLVENDGVTTHPAAAQSVTFTWDGTPETTGVIAATLSGSNAFDADGDWGTIDRVRIIRSGGDTWDIPIANARALLNNYDLTIPSLAITIT